MAFLSRGALSVVSAALIESVCLSLMPEGFPKKCVKTLFGTWILLVLVSCLRALPSLDLREWNAGLADGGAAAAQGEKTSWDAYAQIIKNRLEEYIETEAASEGVTLDARITLSDTQPPVPIFVELRGEVPWEVRQRLSQKLSEDLSITKENQLWTTGH